MFLDIRSNYMILFKKKSLRLPEWLTQSIKGFTNVTFNFYQTSFHLSVLKLVIWLSGIIEIYTGVSESRLCLHPTDNFWKKYECVLNDETARYHRTSFIKFSIILHCLRTLIKNPALSYAGELHNVTLQNKMPPRKQNPQTDKLTLQKSFPCILTVRLWYFPFTCEATAHFRCIILFLILCVHYASILHIIVRLGSLWSRLLGARLQVLQSISGSHFPTEGLAGRLGRSIIVT